MKTLFKLGSMSLQNLTIYKEIGQLEERKKVKITLNMYFYEISEEFRTRFNNHRCVHRNHRKNRKVKQESFHAHFADDVHSGEGDWEVRCS